jgi:hypothetical protein
LQRRHGLLLLLLLLLHCLLLRMQRRNGLLRRRLLRWRRLHGRHRLLRLLLMRKGLLLRLH